MRIRDFTNTNKPVIVIVNILHPTVPVIIDMLLEQQARIILIDYLSVEVKKFIKKYKKQEDILFVDLNFVSEHLESFQKIDYIYHFVSQLVVGSSYPVVKKDFFEMVNLTNKEFVAQSNYIDMFIKLAIEFNSKYTLITSGYLGQLLYKPNENNLQLQRYAESLFDEYYARGAFNGRVIRVAEVIGEDMDLTVPTFLTRLLRELVSYDTVTILGEGLQNNYLVDVKDAAFGILKASFSKQTQGRKLLLSDLNPISTVNLVYRALELTADEKSVEFVDIKAAGFELGFQKELERVCVSTPLTNYIWEPQVELEESLKAALAYAANKVGGVFNLAEEEKDRVRQKLSKGAVKPIKLGERRKERFSLEQTFWGIVEWGYKAFVEFPLKIVAKIGSLPQQAKKPSFWFNIAKALLFVGTVFLLMPYVEILYGVSKGLYYSQKLKQNLRNKEFDAAYQNILSIKDGALKVNYAVSWINYWKYLGRAKQYEAIKTATDALYYEIEAAEQLFKSSIPVVKYITNVDKLSGANYTYLVEMASMIDTVQNAYQDHLLAMKLFDSIRPEDIIWPLRNKYIEGIDKLRTFDAFVKNYKKVYPYLPYLLGYRNPTNYVVLFQNNYELRPTGGWITGVGLFTVENGNLKKKVIEDVYQLDGQLKGLSAPKDFKDYTGYSNVKIATANWSPELPEVKNTMEKLLTSKDYLDKVDIIATIDFTAVEQLLDAIGGVHVEGFGTVTSKNLFEIMVQLHKDFKPGSVAKAEFFSTLWNEVQKKLMSLSAPQLINLAATTQNLVETKHIQIYGDFLQKSGLLIPGSTYVDLNTKQQPIMLVEWNSAGNKSNKCLVRFWEYDFDIDKQELDLKITYNNKCMQKTYPYGDYASITRLILPKTWIIGSSKGLNNVKTYKYSDGLQEIIGSIKVPIGFEHTVEFVIKLPKSLEEVNIIKQPGTQSEKIVFTIKGKAVNEQLLKEQGFDYKLDAWVKIEEFKGDKVVRLR